MNNNSYQLNNNSYYIFKTEESSSQLMVYFFWAKFDFRIFLHAVERELAEASPKESFQTSEGNYFMVSVLEHKHHDQWYQYERISEHGLSYEETEWHLDNKTHYAEFPKDFYKIAKHIAEKELNLTSLWNVPA